MCLRKSRSAARSRDVVLTQSTNGQITNSVTYCHHPCLLLRVLRTAFCASIRVLKIVPCRFVIGTRSPFTSRCCGIFKHSSNVGLPSSIPTTTKPRFSRDIPGSLGRKTTIVSCRRPPTAAKTIRCLDSMDRPGFAPDLAGLTCSRASSAAAGHRTHYTSPSRCRIGVFLPRRRSNSLTDYQSITSERLIHFTSPSFRWRLANARQQSLAAYSSLKSRSYSLQGLKLIRPLPSKPRRTSH